MTEVRLENQRTERGRESAVYDQPDDVTKSQSGNSRSAHQPP